MASLANDSALGVKTVPGDESRDGVLRAPDGFLGKMAAFCEREALPELADGLRALSHCLAIDVPRVEAVLAALARTPLESPSRKPAGRVRQSGAHLLAAAGKRMRPMCVALGARVGGGFTDQSLELGIAAELIHNATLLHDDVVDVGNERRGQPTARVLFGNTASVFAGDWLIVEAFRRVLRSEVPSALESLLATLDAMIEAEALQLELRGRFDATLDDYFSVVLGKTASLFEWALGQGGRAGNLDNDSCEALVRYGRSLGIAFQIVDDVLDFAGESKEWGKSLFADVREGKLTYPILLARDREPRTLTLLHDVMAGARSSVVSTGTPDAQAGENHAVLEIRRILESTGALQDARSEASRHAADAVRSLEALPQNEGTRGLMALAFLATERVR